MEIPFPLARMKYSLKNTIYWTKKLLPYESLSEKIKENGFFQQKDDFF